MGNFTDHPFWHLVAIGDPSQCWQWLGKTYSRYGYGTYRGMGAHRAAYQLVHGVIVEQGVVIRHACDNPSCVNPHHLLAGTTLDNIADRVARGRSACGERNGRAKLTADQARDIFYRVKSEHVIKLAREYGVDAVVIRDIRERRKWKTATMNLSES